MRQLLILFRYLNNRSSKQACNKEHITHTHTYTTQPSTVLIKTSFVNPALISCIHLIGELIVVCYCSLFCSKTQYYCWWFLLLSSMKTLVIFMVGWFIIIFASWLVSLSIKTLLSFVHSLVFRFFLFHEFNQWLNV